MSGEFAIHEGTLSGNIVLAGRTIERPTITLNDRFSWGNLGSKALADSVLTIDHVNQRLTIEPSAKADAAKAAKPEMPAPRGPEAA